MADIRGVSLCGQAMIVTPQYVRDASGSVLFPDRLLHKLHGRGLAKSTICWISLSPSSSSLYSLSLPLLLSVCFVFPPPPLYYKCRSKNTAILRLFTQQELVLVRTESSVKDESSRFFVVLFFQSICYQTSLGMQQSLVREPAFLAISRMI